MWHKIKNWIELFSNYRKLLFFKGMFFYFVMSKSAVQLIYAPVLVSIVFKVCSSLFLNIILVLSSTSGILGCVTLRIRVIKISFLSSRDI